MTCVTSKLKHLIASAKTLQCSLSTLATGEVGCVRNSSYVMMDSLSVWCQHEYVEQVTC